MLSKGDAFRALLDVSPNHVPALVNYGNLLNETACLNEACEHFVRAIEIDPETIRLLEPSFHGQ